MSFNSDSFDSEIAPLIVINFHDNPEGIEGRIPWYKGSFVLVNVLVGGSLLNFPYAMDAAGGFWIGFAIEIVMAVLVCSSIFAMVWVSGKAQCNIYKETVNHYLGNNFETLNSVVILCVYFLSSCFVLLASVQQLREGLLNLCNGTGTEWWSNQAFIAFLQVSLLIFPLCLTRNIEKFYIISSIGIGALCFVMIVIIYEFYKRDTTTDVVVKTSPEKWSDVFLAIPAFSIAFTFDTTSVAVYGRLRNKTMTEYLKTSLGALFLVLILYNVSTYYAYATFGQEIDDNFMRSYKGGDVLIGISQLLYALKLSFEYPVLQFHGWTSISPVWSANCSARVPQFFSHYLRPISSALWVAITYCAVFLPTINYLIPLSSVGVLQLQFTFSGLCLLKYLSEHQDSMDRIKRIALTVFGCFCIFLGLFLGLTVLIQFIIEPK